MDLVSSTLDKYLKHRFNGNGEIKNETNDILTTRTETNNRPLKVYHVNLGNLLPCCVALREDFQFIAAGFENSQIYLWSLNAQIHDDDEDDDDREDEGTSNGINQVNDSILATSMSRLLGHSGSVYSIVYVKNNDLMLSCSEDTTIRLWCLKTKCNLSVFRGHNYPIWTLAVAPQGEYFASASMDATARLWRLDEMCPLRIFCGHDDDVECIQFHPNEKYLASGSTDSTVRLWSVSDGKMVRLMVGHKSTIISLSFLPNGKFLASASSDGSIKVWNLATNCVTSDLSVPASHTISFSPSQKFVSSCGIDNILRLWRVDDSSLFEEKKVDFSEHATKLIQTQYHMDNKLFVVLRRQKQEQMQPQDSMS